MLENHSSNTNNRSVIKPPTDVVVHNMFDDPISQMSIATSSSKIPVIIKNENIIKKTPESTTIMKDKEKEVECKVNDDEKLKPVKKPTKIMKDVEKVIECKVNDDEKLEQVKHDLTLNHKTDSETTDSDKTESDCESETDIDSLSGSERKMILKKMNVGKIKQILLI